MSFCCGAGMVGIKGTLKHIRTLVHHVPLLFCPVCQRVEVHYKAAQEYELLAEYAHDDGAVEVDFTEYTDSQRSEVYYENCISDEQEAPVDILSNQIDSALDLLAFAKQLRDEEWEEQLKHRLSVLSRRKTRMLRDHTASPNT